MTSKFRIVALLEAVSFLALLAATIFHRVLDGSDAGVNVLGPDLQYVRINGTVVGAVAGLLLHAVSTALS